MMEMAEKAAAIGAGVTIWQILMFLSIYKAIGTMWILFTTAQFIVYMSKFWTIQWHSNIAKSFFQSLKRLVLGEFFDDLQLGKWFLGLLGSTTEKDEISGMEQ